MAIQYGRSEIVQVLLQAGAKISLEYLASLPFRSLTEEKERIWTILCKERPVESVCVMILAQSNTGQDEGIWLPLFNDLLQQEKVEVLTCLCKMDALVPVEWFLRKKFFCHSEMKKVLRNVLCSSYTVHRPQIVECLLLQDIILSEKDFDMLVACLKLEQADLVQKFLKHVPCLHLWNEDLCRELILGALKSDDCTSLEVLVQHMGSGVINSISLSSVIDICVKDRKGMTLKSKMGHLLKNGYLIVDWDYLDLFETLARRKRFEQLKVVLSLLPLATASRNKDHFLKIAIKTQTVELVKRVKLICEEGNEIKFSGGKYKTFGKVQEIYKNWHQVRHFKQFDKEEKRYVWSPKKNNYTKQVKSPFHLAVTTGHLELVKLFSADRLSVAFLRDAVQHTQVLEYFMSHLDKESDTLKRKFIFKAANCNKNILQVLLKSYKCLVQAELDKLLKFAVKCEKVDIAVCLLEKDAKVYDENKDRLLDLLLCKLDVLSYALKQEIIAVDEKNSDDIPLLFLACASEKIDAVQILLSYGASPNIIVTERTPLLFALQQNNTELVKVLLKHPEMDDYKSDALGFALDSCNAHILMTILESLKNIQNSVSPQNLYLWSIEDVLQIVKMLLRRSTSLPDSEMTEIAALTASLIADTENESITLDVSHLQDIIFECIKCDFMHLTEFLLQLGFKANDEVCCEFFMKAQFHRTLEMLHVLLKYLPLDALPERVTRKPILQKVISKFIVSPLEPSVYRIEQEGLVKNILQLILDKGGDLYRENSKGETALSCAAKIKSHNICEFVIQKGYHSRELVEHYAKQCESALTHAVSNRDVAITQLMIKSGFCNGLNKHKLHQHCTTFLLSKNSLEIDLMMKYMLDIGVIPEGWNNVSGSRTFLQLAMQHGYYHIALNLLKEGYSPFVSDCNNNSLLHLVWHGIKQQDECRRVQFIDKILECRVSINSRNTEGMTPLLCAVINKDAALVQILLGRGSECDTALPQSHSTYPGCTALHIACQTHQYSMVNTLLKAGANVTRKDARKRTALHYICKTRAMNERPPFEIARHLVHAGARVMDPDLNNEHPVDHAIRSELFEIVHFLLSHLPDDDEVLYKTIHKLMKYTAYRGKWGTTVESLFRNVGDGKTKFILSHSQKYETAGKDLTSLCVSAGNLSLYHTIVMLGKGEHQIKLNAAAHLHALIRSKSVDLTLLHYILETGVDVNQVDMEGRPLAHIACAHDQLQVLEILFKHGANINIQDKFDCTPIHACVILGAQKCLSFLLRCSEYVNRTTTAKCFLIHAGSTALMMCVTHYPDSSHVSYTRYKYMLDLLLKHGANPNIADIKGNNALHIAVARQLPIMVVTKLVKRIRDINATNQKSQSALHLAMNGDISTINKEVVEFLLKKGCNPNLPMPSLKDTTEGDTVLHLAVRGLQRDLAEIFLRYGSDLLVKNSAGETPLSMCLLIMVMGKNNQLVSNSFCLLDLLLKAGAHLPHLDMTDSINFLRIDQKLLCLLLKSGCRIRPDATTHNSNRTTEAQNAILKLINDHESHPLSLETLSANVVRRALKPNALYGVEKLPVPLYLRNIILMKYVTFPTEDDSESCADSSKGDSFDTNALECFHGTYTRIVNVSDGLLVTRDYFFNRLNYILIWRRNFVTKFQTKEKL